MPPKPLALPNVSQATIAKAAYDLFGAMAVVDQASAALSETRKTVAERGVDPGILADVLKEAKADPWSRIERDRTLGQYIAALKVPGLVAVEPDMLDALEEPAPETDEEREAREYAEGYWAYLTHLRIKDDAPDAWVNGWYDAHALVNAE